VPAPAADKAAVAPAVPKADYAGLEKYFQAELHRLVYPGEGPSATQASIAGTLAKEAKLHAERHAFMAAGFPLPRYVPRYVTLWWT
jgi:hypothetical protein